MRSLTSTIELFQTKIILFQSKNDINYVASVPELPGCVSQGKTLDETIENIKDAIKGYLHVQASH